MNRCFLWNAALIVLTSRFISGQTGQQQVDLTATALEDLMNLKVTSASRSEQRLSQTSAAAFVITAEDIRQSSAFNIPDLLRMVPGMNVAQINANTWAISARGFNGRFSNELLVMVDGRTVYVPIFGGVFWDVLDMPLEDIERIEVIRGPGGSMWGANAVNGVVNIITRKSTDTHGGLISLAGASGNVTGSGTVQYGGSIGKSTSYRGFVKFFDQGGLPPLSTPGFTDEARMFRGGFRVDRTISSNDTLMVQGDLYGGHAGGILQTLPSLTSRFGTTNAAIGLSGGFVQGVWTHRFSSRADTKLQVSYDAYERNDVLNERRGTLDLDFQNHLALGERNDLVWGFEYRRSASTTTGNLAFVLSPAALTTDVFSSFVQDDIALAHDKLYLTLGTKVEHDHYTGITVMPTTRIAWIPREHHTIWAAVSRAVRTPAADDTSMVLNLGLVSPPGAPPAVVRIAGNPDSRSEGVVSYELGYRAAAGERLTFDLATYFNRYDHQDTTEPLAPLFQPTPAPGYLVLGHIYQNLLYGETHGLELFANWTPIPRWTLSPGYSFEQFHMHLKPGSHDTTSVAEDQGNSPVHSAQLRSHVALTRRLSWDTFASFVGRLSDPAVPSYTRLDSGISWQWNKGLSLSAGGQNLLKGEHLEFIDTTLSSAATLVKRGAYARLVWTF